MIGRRGQRVVSVLTTVVMVGAILLATIMVLPTLLGYERYVIVSGSMEPTLSVGTIVYDEVVPVEDLAVGDIITFVPPPEFGVADPVTHRIYEITVAPSGAGERVLRTKGDNNPEVDPWRMVLDGPEQARVRFHVPVLGYAYMALEVRWVQVVVIVVPAILLVVYLTVSLWRLSGDAVRAEKAAARAGGSDPEPDPEEVAP